MMIIIIIILLIHRIHRYVTQASTTFLCEDVNVAVLGWLYYISGINIYIYIYETIVYLWQNDNL